jgi:Polyketide cyclase / dehydrase and lipid transport
MRIERSIDLPCGAEEAWAVLTDWERQADWMLDADAVEVMSEPREGVGVRLAVRTRLFQVPGFTETIEVVAWEPPTELVIAHGPPIRGRGTWALDARDGATTFTWTEEVELAASALGGIVSACYAPVLGALLRRSLRGLRGSIIARGPVRG